MQGNGLHKTKLTVFVVLALALSVLSFHGALDDFAHESVVETTTESFALFAISKGINAAVSLLQSLEFEGRLFVASTSIRLGELLDPINDAVEKLSSVMLWAIGSLAIQRIILEIASSSFFNTSGRI